MEMKQCRYYQYTIIHNTRYPATTTASVFYFHLFFFCIISLFWCNVRHVYRTSRLIVPVYPALLHNFFVCLFGCWCVFCFFILRRRLIHPSRQSASLHQIRPFYGTVINLRLLGMKEQPQNQMKMFACILVFFCLFLFLFRSCVSVFYLKVRRFDLLDCFEFALFEISNRVFL